MMKQPEQSPPSGALHDRERRAELGRFLRAHREALSPPEESAPARRRRRTPGLRREEVADVAGMSPVWYTWLEMGRQVQTSSRMLERIALGLQLSEEEKAHLFRLAGRQQPLIEKSCVEQVLPAVRELIDRYANPACVLGARLDLLATNASYRELFRQTEHLEGFEHNILWRIFSLPEKKERFVDWRTQTEHLTALFRRNYAHFVGAPEFEMLIDRLQESSAEFRELWQKQHILQWAPREVTFDFPGTGKMKMQLVYLTAPWDELQVIVFGNPKGE